MVYLWYFVALIVWSTIIAKIEIQMEGRHGWAKYLPTTRWQMRKKIISKRPFGEDTWMMVKGNIFLKIILKMLGGRDLTLYHLYGIVMQFFVATFVILFFFGSQGLATIILRIFSFVWFVQAVEDTIWFALNPNYRLKNYKKETIAWHAQDWWYFAPKTMIMLMLLAMITFAIPFLF